METVNTIIDLYKWLPEYGENSINFYSADKDTIVVIEYDTKDDLEFDYARRKIIFESCSYFMKSSFPGPVPNIEDISDRPSESLGDLVEFPSSQFAKKWNEHYARSGDPYSSLKYYEVSFMSENILLRVIAENVILTKEEFFN